MFRLGECEQGPPDRLAFQTFPHKGQVFVLRERGRAVSKSSKIGDGYLLWDRP